MSLVIGPNTGYAWIITRAPNPSAIDCQAFYDQAQAIGVDTGHGYGFNVVSNPTPPG